MKIKLEFEEEDFHKMLETYFNDTGWEVLNLPEVVDQFATAFPGGIIVEATTKAVDALPAPRARAVKPADAEDTSAPIEEAYYTEDPLDTEGFDDGEENPTLGLSELMDPIGKEISYLLSESERLK